MTAPINIDLVTSDLAEVQINYCDTGASLSK